MVHFGEFLKTWSLRSNSVTRQINFNRTKIGGNAKIEKFKWDKFGWFCIWSKELRVFAHFGQILISVSAQFHYSSEEIIWWWRQKSLDSIYSVCKSLWVLVTPPWRKLERWEDERSPELGKIAQLSSIRGVKKEYRIVHNFHLLPPE